MALYFYKIDLQRVTSNITSQVDTFRVYTDEVKYSVEADEIVDFCARTSSAIENAISVISSSRDELLRILDSIKQEYTTVKKTEKKEFLEEFQQTEKNVAYIAALRESDAVLTALRTRLTEVRFELAKALGKHIPDITFMKTGDVGLLLDHPRTDTDVHSVVRDQPDQILHSNVESFIAPPHTSHSFEHQHAAEDTSATHEMPIETADIRDSIHQHKEKECEPSIQPPRINIPQFAGEIDKFQEYWAVYETMVHKNPTLNAMEKIILLKESLVGRAANTIRGIKMIPENYQWMIHTIKKRYDNVTSTRANVIKRLVSLPPAKDYPRSCESVFDDIRALVNEMTSSGYAIANTCDPMWTETILKKLPRSVVEEFLRGNKTEEAFTVGETLDQLEKVILRHTYISQRLGLQDSKPKQDTSFTRENTAKIVSCTFCGRTNHKSYECRTVKDAHARRKVVMEKNLCWKCFAADHKSSDCKRPHCKRCNRLHDESLCLQKENASSSEKTQGKRPVVQTSLQVTPQSSEECSQEGDQQSQLTNTPPMQPHLGDSSTIALHEQVAADKARCTATNEQIVLMTAEGLVWNYSSNQYERALFFFDTGAQVSLMLEKSAEQLALPVSKTERYSLSGISGMTETFLSHNVVLRVQTAQGRELEFSVKTKPTITAGFPAVYLTERDTLYMERHNLFLTNTRMRGELQLPHVLIGLDLYDHFVNESSPLIQLPTGLKVARTIFGLAAYGRGRIEKDVCRTSHMTCNTLISDTEMLRNMFELEGLGISTKEGADDEEAYMYLSKYAKLLHYDGKCVSAPFPLKASIVDLTDNYSMALRRLVAQLKHLEQHPERKQWYIKIISQYRDDEVIEEVIEPVPESAGTYYMPHSGVWKEHKSTPLRIVFDASSKQRGHLSLNDVIHTGASFVNKIHDILIASREKPIILVADIQAAFTQIRIHEAHRDLCRFLWVRDPNKPPTRTNLIEYRWKRVPFGITSSPSMLNMVIEVPNSSNLEKTIGERCVNQNHDVLGILIEFLLIHLLLNHAKKSVQFSQCYSHFFMT